jgi:hypothetical protein
MGYALLLRFSRSILKLVSTMGGRLSDPLTKPKTKKQQANTKFHQVIQGASPVDKAISQKANRPIERAIG